jgi:hypothetical protein
MKSITESRRDVPVSGQSGAKAPALYQAFDGQHIDGSWRPGKHGGVQVDPDPYSGAMLAETLMANQGDLDEAYHAATRAPILALGIPMYAMCMVALRHERSQKRGRPAPFFPPASLLGCA